jgi:hypothetical protein
VFNDATDNLPALLRGYEEHGGLTVNWRMFGSSEGRATPRWLPEERGWGGSSQPGEALHPLGGPRGGWRAQWRPHGCPCCAGGYRTRQANTLTAFTKCYDWQVRPAGAGAAQR